MIQEGLNIPSQETSMNILPELSDGLNVLLDSLVKSSFVIEKQPPQVTTNICLNLRLTHWIAGIENKHKVQRDYQVVGGHQAERAHVPPGGDGLHHLRVPGKLPAEGGPHQEDQACVVIVSTGGHPGQVSALGGFL